MSQADLSTATMYRLLSNDEKKKLEAPLLLGTTYSLNYSGTKKISTGLQPRVNGDIVPVVVLQNNNSSGGIVFESAAWTKLLASLAEISSYFKGAPVNSAWRAGSFAYTTMKIEDFEVSFSTAFGSKSIVFDRAVTESTSDASDDTDPGNDEQTPLEPPQKKKKQNYSPAVVMQKPTFEGLCNVSVCVDERFRRLQRYATHVQKCADALCAALLMHIPSNEEAENVDEPRVKELLTQNKRVLHDGLRCNIDSSFLEYYDIMFLELSAFCIPYITNELKKILEDASSVATQPSFSPGNCNVE